MIIFIMLQSYIYKENHVLTKEFAAIIFLIKFDLELNT